MLTKKGTARHLCCTYQEAYSLQGGKRASEMRSCQEIIVTAELQQYKMKRNMQRGPSFGSDLQIHTRVFFSINSNLFHCIIGLQILLFTTALLKMCIYSHETMVLI